jgi:S1-C subfamily serine protease
MVRVKATFRRGRFFGWRVLAYSGPGPVQPGDIVVRVNRHSVERPNQFMKVWEQLPDQPELVVEMVRGGRRLTLRYPIVDQEQ